MGLGSTSRNKTASAAGLAPLPFVKMHGLGNDFLLLDRRARQDVRPLPAALVQRLGDRRSGVGFDQLIVLDAPDPALNYEQGDARVTFYNTDSSEAGACGNGSRCLADWLMRDLGRDRVSFRTRAGLLGAIRAADGEVSVDMGTPGLGWAQVPLARAMQTGAVDVGIAGLPTGIAVSMGNPHIVFLVDDADAVPIGTWGPRIEYHPLFPDRTNVEFVSPLTGGRWRMRVWERSVGVTRACGSGACASAVALHRADRISGPVDLLLDGGRLSIDWTATGTVTLKGPVATVFHGTLTSAWLSDD
jgi:diaminopimelate epimerase